MKSNIIHKNENFSENRLNDTDYIDCRFERCIFAGADLSEINFDGCSFVNCDLSNARVEKTSFHTIDFTECKLIGVRFDFCNPFNVVLRFENFILNYASFHHLKLPETLFLGCKMIETDLTAAQLTGSDFSGSDLSGAAFEGINLEKCNFSTAVHYIIHPEKNKIKKAKFSVAGLPGLLTAYKIIIDEI